MIWVKDFQTRLATGPHWSRNTGFGATLLASLVLNCSCQVPADSHVAGDVNAVRRASTVITKPYLTGSKHEVATNAGIVAQKEAFLESATSGASEQASALARGFGSQRGIGRESWWNADIQESILATSGKTLAMGLDDIYCRTLVHSNQVKVFAAIPLIRETAIIEAEAEFDPEVFAQSRLDRRNEPSGSLVQRSGAGQFFRERGWTFEGGVRKRFVQGTEIDLSQQLSAVSNNSEFFSPNNQGRARVTLSVMQPLLRGAGTRYNRSLIQIAKLETDDGYNEFIGELESHIMEVNRYYWALYLARGTHLEKKRLVAETEVVVAEIESRSDLDSISSQRSRARAALASRKADLIRSELEIKNAESRLRTLINDPAFVEQGVGEVIPADLPIASMAVTAFDASILEALEFRPEVHLAANKLRAADIREGVAKNEKLPELNLIGEFGTSTLRGNGDWTGAFADQYNGGEPTWGVGLVASIPLERRAAKARHLRSQLEARQAKDEVRAVMDQVLLEVQIAHREVVTAWPDAIAKWEAAKAADQELAVLRDRRDVETAESGTSLYLENVLDAQQRRTFAREDFLMALSTYNAALTNLERAKGTLLQQEEIGIKRESDAENLPLLQLVKDEASAAAKALYDTYK
jgi:outer membrane protein TolC